VHEANARTPIQNQPKALHNRQERYENIQPEQKPSILSQMRLRDRQVSKNINDLYRMVEEEDPHFMIDGMTGPAVDS